MIEEITSPIIGIRPSAQATLMPHAASNPVMMLKTIATQNGSFFLLFCMAMNTVTRLKTIRPMNMMLTITASDSIITKCLKGFGFFTVGSAKTHRF